MTVIPFPTPATPLAEPTSPGALEVIRDYLERVQPLRAARPFPSPGDLPDADYFLTWLAYRGFAVVPLDSVTLPEWPE